MRVASYSKIDLKIEFCGSKNPLGTLRFALIKSFDLRKNRPLRMRIASYTKIDLKIEFSGSKNPLCDLWHKSYMTIYESYTSLFYPA